MQANESLAAGHAAASAALGNAGASWHIMARETLMTYARRADQFMAEDVVAYAELIGLPPPPDRRAWGGVIIAARNDGLLKRVGYSQTRSQRYNSSPKSVWQLS